MPLVSRKDAQNAALDWAADMSLTSDDPPWAKCEFLKLRETLEAIVVAMEVAAQPVEPQVEPEPDNSLRLVASNDERESAEGLAVDRPAKPAA